VHQLVKHGQKHKISLAWSVTGILVLEISVLQQTKKFLLENMVHLFKNWSGLKMLVLGLLSQT